MSNITTGQLSELLAQAQAGRVTKENLQGFLRHPNTASTIDWPSYKVDVDYEEDLPDLVSAGNYNSSVTEALLEFSSYYRTVGSGVEHQNLLLVHLDVATTSELVLNHLEATGMRSANFWEQLALGAQHPELQRRFHIVALGSPWLSPGGKKSIFSLSGDAQWRFISRAFFETYWDRHIRFLAVSTS